jgi:hypothetical protein
MTKTRSGDGGAPLNAYMTHREAAAHHDVVLATIYNAVNRGEIATEEVLGKTVLLRSSVLAWSPRSYGARSRGEKGREE